MATEISINPEPIQSFFSKLEARKALLSTIADIHKTLTSHFSAVDRALSRKSETLDARIRTLRQNTNNALTDLRNREDGFPEREISMAARVEVLKAVAIAEIESPDTAGKLKEKSLPEMMRFYCRRMDASGLMKFLFQNRRDSAALRSEIPDAVKESVDAMRLVLDAAEDYVRMKVEGKSGMADRRRACGMLIQSVVPIKEGGGVVAKALKEKAAGVLEKWKGVLRSGGERCGGIRPNEASMFLQLVVGFGLKQQFEEDFLRKLIVQFASRRDMPRLTIALGFGNKMADIIDQLVKSGKELEAIYFASEAGLAEQYPPVSLLKSALRTCKRNAKDTSKRGNFSGAAVERANKLELDATRAIMQCVEDLKLETQFPLDTLKKRVEQLENVKSGKRKSSSSSHAIYSQQYAYSTADAPPTGAPRGATHYAEAAQAPGTYEQQYGYSAPDATTGALHTGPHYVAQAQINYGGSPAAPSQQQYMYSPKDAPGVTTHEAAPGSYGGPSDYAARVRSITSGAAIGNANGGGGGASKDDYFATIHHISNIVRRDIYLERTLNKMRISTIVNSELVYRVLRSCSQHGIESFRFFNWARIQHPQYDPTTVEFEELLKTLARTAHWETMWKVIQQMKAQNVEVSPSMASFIIEQYGKHGLIDQAVELFNRLNNLNCLQTTEVYNSLLFALCEVKNFQGAYALIRRMIRKGTKPDKRTYSVLVNGWCSAGKMREAQRFLEEMSQKGFNPPVRGRDLLIDGLLSAGYLESAKGLVRKMTKEGFIPDVETFNSLAEAVCKSGEADFCIDLFHDVCRLGLCPDVETYKITIAAASKLGRMDDAFRILHRCIEDGNRPFPSLYAPILKALCRRGQFDDAFSFFSDVKVKVKGHPPNRPVYTMLVKMCCRGGRFVEAANYLVEMTEVNLLPMSQSFDMVTDGLKHCGKHDLAKRIEQLEISIRGV
nr:pentatricopeptide repeat-containing protein At5g18390, mitochondrial [Ipomoea batatas]